MFLKKRNDMINQKNKKGLTLIETLIVLGIFAGVVAGIFTLVNSVQRSAAVTQETNNLTSMYTNIEGFFRRGSTDGLFNQQALISGFIPDGMFIEAEGADAATLVANGFDGYVQIQGSQGPAGNSRGFSIQYTGVPADACSEFVANQVGTGWDTVYISGDDSTAVTTTADGTELYMYSTDGTGGARGNQPLAEITIITNCDVTNDFVRITFVKDQDA